jgi:hypothetical protein
LGGALTAAVHRRRAIILCDASSTRTLSNSDENQDELDEKPGLLFRSKGLHDLGGYKEIFYENLSYNIRPTQQFLKSILADIYASDVNAENLKKYVVRFQNDFDIHNDLEFMKEWQDFVQSIT